MVSPTTGQGECWHLSATGVLTTVPAMRHAARNPEHCPPRPASDNRLAVVLSPCSRDLVACRWPPLRSPFSGLGEGDDRELAARRHSGGFSLPATPKLRWIFRTASE